MKKRVLLLALPAMLLPTASNAAANTQGDKPMTSIPGLSCEIRTESRSGMLELSAMAIATARISGIYKLTVTSRSSGGSSDVTQGGDFSARPGDEVVLGTLSINHGAYTAKLTLETAAGTATCELPAKNKNA